MNCQIENPAFDSQTKETLTTKPTGFGSTCTLSEKFLKEVIASGVIESIVVGVLAHEFGHAAKDLFDLPVVGNEETAADQFAIGELLPTDSSTAYYDIDAVGYVADLWDFFGHTQALTPSEYQDVHPVNLQRAAQINCLFYGALRSPGQLQNSQTSYWLSVLSTGKLVASDRAPGCTKEYKEMIQSYRKMLGPYLKK